MISYHMKQNCIHLHPLRKKIYIIAFKQNRLSSHSGTLSKTTLMESSEDLELLHAENAPREIPRSRSLKLRIALVP